jgi:hypothetical protein
MTAAIDRRGLKGCPHCGSNAGAYVEVTMRQVYHFDFLGKLVRPVESIRSTVLHSRKTVRCIACNRGFRWKPPSPMTA